MPKKKQQQQRAKYNVHVSNFSVIQTRGNGSTVYWPYQQFSAIYITISTVSTSFSACTSFHLKLLWRPWNALRLCYDVS